MGAVRVTLLAAVRRFGGKKAVCVARVSASRVRGRVTYFNADRTINTFVVATEAMFCADFKRGVDGPSSPPLLLASCYPLSFHWFWSTDKLLWTNTRIKSLICHIPHPPPDIHNIQTVFILIHFNVYCHLRGWYLHYNMLFKYCILLKTPSLFVVYSKCRF